MKSSNRCPLLSLFNLLALVNDRFENHRVNVPQMPTTTIAAFPTDDNKRIGRNGYFTKTVTQPILAQFWSIFLFENMYKGMYNHQQT